MIDRTRENIAHELDDAMRELNREATLSSESCRPFIHRQLIRLQAEREWITHHRATHSQLQTRRA